MWQINLGSGKQQHQLLRNRFSCSKQYPLISPFYFRPTLFLHYNKHFHKYTRKVSCIIEFPNVNNRSSEIHFHINSWTICIHTTLDGPLLIYLLFMCKKFLMSWRINMRVLLYRPNCLIRMKTFLLQFQLMDIIYNSIEYYMILIHRPTESLVVLDMKFITFMYHGILLFIGWRDLRFNSYKSQVIDTSAAQISSTFSI